MLHECDKVKPTGGLFISDLFWNILSREGNIWEAGPHPAASHECEKYSRYVEVPSRNQPLL